VPRESHLLAELELEAATPDCYQALGVIPEFSRCRKRTAIQLQQNVWEVEVVKKRLLYCIFTALIYKPLIINGAGGGIESLSQVRRAVCQSRLHLRFTIYDLRAF
jgi:hypothetical protein